MNKQEKENICQGIAEELERDVERYLEWQAPQIALDENAKLYNELAVTILELLSKRYK